MKKIIFIFLCLMLSFESLATLPTELFRRDTRPPEKIFVEGFKSPGTNANLLEHVSGMSLNPHSGIPASGIRSTSSSWSWVTTPRYPIEEFWVYSVTPDHNFFSVVDSFEHYISNPANPNRDFVSSVLNLYREQSEWAAVGDINPSSIRWAARFRQQGGRYVEVERRNNPEAAPLPEHSLASPDVYPVNVREPLTVESIISSPETTDSRRRYTSLSMTSCFGATSGSSRVTRESQTNQCTIPSEGKIWTENYVKGQGLTPPEDTYSAGKKTVYTGLSLLPKFRTWLSFSDGSIDGFCSHGYKSSGYKIVCSRFEYKKSAFTIEHDVDDEGWQQGDSGYADINGDGSKDFVRLVWLKTHLRANLLPDLNQVDGDYFDGGWAWARWWADYNGDGADDYCRVVGRYQLKCLISNKNGTNPLSSNEDVELTNTSWDDFSPSLNMFRDFVSINGNKKNTYCFIRNYSANNYGGKGRLSCLGVWGGNNYAETVPDGISEFYKLVVNNDSSKKESICYVVSGNTLKCISHGSQYYTQTFNLPGKNGSDSVIKTKVSYDAGKFNDDICYLNSAAKKLGCLVSNKVGGYKSFSLDIPEMTPGIKFSDKSAYVLPATKLAPARYCEFRNGTELHCTNIVVSNVNTSSSGHDEL